MSRFFPFVLVLICWGDWNYSWASAEDSLKVRRIVVKSCIVLTNSKPRRNEIDSICAKYQLYQKSIPHYYAFLDDLMNSPAYATAICAGYQDEYLQGVTASQMEDDIGEFSGLLENKAQSDFWDAFKSIRDKISAVRSAKEELASGKISEAEAQKRFFNNKYYNDLNMGAHNYVVSTFNYLFFRNPTIQEQTEGEKFINGDYGVLFFKTGNSKSDYLDVLFGSEQYKEGQIRYWFKRLLNRDPSAAEEIELMNCTSKTDVKMIIKKILSR